jgi:hypothetical protein
VRPLSTPPTPACCAVYQPLYALDQTEQAVTFALRALALVPTDRHCASHATELLF